MDVDTPSTTIRSMSRTPYKKRKRSSTTTSRSRDPSAAGSSRTISIPKGCGIFNGIGIPRCLFCKLSFSARLSLSSSTVTPAHHQFRLNSTWDPDVTTTGVQPYGRDQISAMYLRYIVNGATVKVWFSNAGTNGPTQCTIRASVDGTPPSDIEAEADRINGKQIIVSPGESKVLTAYYPIHKIIGMSKAGYSGDPGCSAAYNGNPSKICFLNVMTQNLTGSTDTHVIVKIVYHCKYFDQGDVTPS